MPKAHSPREKKSFCIASTNALENGFSAQRERRVNKYYARNYIKILVVRLHTGYNFTGKGNATPGVPILP